MAARVARERLYGGPAWQGAVWHATWKPLTFAAVVVLVAALAFSHYFPGARTLGEAWMLVHS